MRRIIASEFLSADGYVVGPSEDMKWVMSRFNDEMGRYASGLMDSMDAVILGRVTYEIMARAWPNLTEQESPGADKMNSVKKVVLSRCLKQAPWGKYEPCTVIGDQVDRKLREMKDKPGKNMVIYGSANAVQGLTRTGLIDEYQLLVHPVFLGAGKPLFTAMERPTDLRVVRRETYANGVNLLCYEPARSGAGEAGT